MFVVMRVHKNGSTTAFPRSVGSSCRISSHIIYGLFFCLLTSFSSLKNLAYAETQPDHLMNSSSLFLFFSPSHVKSQHRIICFRYKHNHAPLFLSFFSYALSLQSTVFSTYIFFSLCFLLLYGSEEKMFAGIFLAWYIYAMLRGTPREATKLLTLM